MKKKEIKKPKHIIRAIKKAAKKLPVREYYALEKYDRPKWNEEEQKWRIGEIVTHKVNHARRVKKAYKKYGIPAVNAYFYVFQKIKDEKITDTTASI